MSQDDYNMNVLVSLGLVISIIVLVLSLIYLVREISAIFRVLNYPGETGLGGYVMLVSLVMSMIVIVGSGIGTYYGVRYLLGK